MSISVGSVTATHAAQTATRPAGAERNEVRENDNDADDRAAVQQAHRVQNAEEAHEAPGAADEAERRLGLNIDTHA